MIATVTRRKTPPSNLASRTLLAWATLAPPFLGEKASPPDTRAGVPLRLDGKAGYSVTDVLRDMLLNNIKIKHETTALPLRRPCDQCQ
jgi:hypothetical protein